jgi:hypothetical protein
VRYRTLAIIPSLVGLAFVVAASVAPSAVLFRADVEIVKVLALLGCLAAALAFERGDYLRRAWFFTGACLFLLLVRDLTVLSPSTPRSVQSALVIAANACSIIGTWLMARAWHVAGLDLMESETKRRAFVLAGVVVALLIGGGAIVVDVRAIVRGDLAALVPLASDLGDFVSLCLIAPMAMTAVAMRGGVLRWPWGLFTVSQVCWLFYDASNVLRTQMPGNSSHIFNELFRTLACMYLCVAGLAQRRAVLAPDGD